MSGLQGETKLHGQVEGEIDLGLPADNSPDQLFAVLYDELHRLAQRALGSHARCTMSPTALLHETYINFSGRESPIPNRASFLVYASRAMRGLLMDYIQRKQAEKRGGGFVITSMLTEGTQVDANLEEIVEALEELTQIEPQLVEIVDLRYFCNFSFTEIAAVLGISEPTAQRYWDKARIFLRDQLKHQQARPAASAPPASVAV